MADIESRLGALESITADLQKHVKILDNDITEIKQILGTFATKDDILMLANKIDTGINGILRDALAAVPMKHMAVWACVTGVTGIVGAILALLAYGMH